MLLLCSVAWGLYGVGSGPTELCKIYIDEDGIYRIGYRDLADAGCNLSQVTPHSIQLWNRGREIPILCSAEFTTRYTLDGTNDYIEFYGEKNRNSDGEPDEYSDTNVYYLTWGKSTGLRWNIEQTHLLATSISFSTKTMFRDTQFRKETFIYSRTAAGQTEEQQNLWYWREIAAPVNDYPFQFTITHPILAPTLFCSLSIVFQGVSYGNHYVVIGLNGNRVGETRWYGRAKHTYQCNTVPMNFFKAGNNVLQISLPGKSGDPTGQASDIDVIYMVQFQLSYWKSFIATNDELVFSAINMNYDIVTSQHEIRGFTNPHINVYDITHKKVIIPAITISSLDSSSSFKAQFTLYNESSSVHYIALTDRQKKSPVKIEKIMYYDLTQDTSGAEYLVITHDDFYPAIQPLLAWRKKTGLTVKCVKTSEVYDTFNYGLVDAKAIKSFLKYAYYNWQPRPRYVLLVGDVSVDLRGNMNLAHARLYIPTYYWATYMGAAASDNWFVAVGEDETKPEMAIGRISAHSIEEVTNVVNKIIQYEQKPNFGQWRQKIFFLASPEPMFEGISEELAKSYVPSYYEVYRRYPSSGSPDYKYRTEDIVENINEGRIILHFTGHGGGYVWESGRMDLERHGVEVVPDNRDFFGVKNILQLKNYGKYPLVIALTCYTGVFDNIDNDSLGEVLLKTPNAGAIAVISATWRSYVSSNDAFDRAMFTQMFKKNVRRLGDIFINAKQEIKLPDISATYVLLGDPGTQLSFPHDIVQLEGTRTIKSKPQIRITGTLDRKRPAKGSVIIKTEKGKLVIQKNITINHQAKFTTKVTIPPHFVQDTLIAYCYLWNEKTKWDAIGYTIVSTVDTINVGQTVGLPALLPRLLWSVTPMNNKDIRDIIVSVSIDNDRKAKQIMEDGDRFYQQKDMLNALLKYSEAFQYGCRDLKMIQRLAKLSVPIETFETATAVQLKNWHWSDKSKIIGHYLSTTYAHRGKKSELIDLVYPIPGWVDYWGKEVVIPLRGPIGVRLFVRGTTESKVELNATVTYNGKHNEAFCSQAYSISSNWIELKINDLYQIAKKRALSQKDISGDIRVYPDLFVSYRSVDDVHCWDIDNMHIVYLGINTRGRNVQLYVDDIELFFPPNKLKVYLKNNQ
ncbi:MAG: C25 family cysteine peptidase [bacterium]|nr:C25 family cysteine peptidase [bacterium]